MKKGCPCSRFKVFKFANRFNKSSTVQFKPGCNCTMYIHICKALWLKSYNSKGWLSIDYNGFEGLWSTALCEKISLLWSIYDFEEMWYYTKWLKLKQIRVQPKKEILLLYRISVSFSRIWYNIIILRDVFCK